MPITKLRECVRSELKTTLGPVSDSHNYSGTKLTLFLVGCAPTPTEALEKTWRNRHVCKNVDYSYLDKSRCLLWRPTSKTHLV